MLKQALAAAAALLSLMAQAAPLVRHAQADVDGIRVFYREAGDPALPTLVLLHGFPASSQMYTGLMEDLADRYHVIAPDYPGSGHTQVPPAARFTPTFDGVADVMERFLQQRKLTRFALYMQDFGGPVGMRLAERHPEWISALVVQNANAYEEGLSAELKRNIGFLAAGIDDKTRPALEHVLGADSVRFMFTAGCREPEAVDPDAQVLANVALADDFNRRVQMALLVDYHSNVESYPAWQRYLRDRRPPTLVVWGRNDPLFTPAGAQAWQRDVPEAEVHLLDTGHFALQEDRTAIAGFVRGFLARTVR
jgi:pimeloyl-ACP methyl ester carboxylesterase